MQNGRRHTPIPPNLYERLGEPQRVIDGEPHWPLNLVAAAIGCNRQCVQNWINEGQIPHVSYDTGRWWISLQSVNYLRAHGPADRGKFERRRARNVIVRFPAERRPRIRLSR